MISERGRAQRAPAPALPRTAARPAHPAARAPRGPATRRRDAPAPTRPAAHDFPWSVFQPASVWRRRFCMNWLARSTLPPADARHASCSTSARSAAIAASSCTGGRVRRRTRALLGAAMGADRRSRLHGSLVQRDDPSLFESESLQRHPPGLLVAALLPRALLRLRLCLLVPLILLRRRRGSRRHEKHRRARPLLRARAGGGSSVGAPGGRAAAPIGGGRRALAGAAGRTFGRRSARPVGQRPSAKGTSASWLSCAARGEMRTTASAARPSSATTAVSDAGQSASAMTGGQVLRAR